MERKLKYRVNLCFCFLDSGLTFNSTARHNSENVFTDAFAYIVINQASAYRLACKGSGSSRSLTVQEWIFPRSNPNAQVQKKR